MIGIALLLAGLLAGCSSVNGADQWPARYHKAGGTAQELAEDGGACQSGTTTALFLGSLLFPVSVAGLALGAAANQSVDLNEHAACMKSKGYTTR